MIVQEVNTKQARDDAFYVRMTVFVDEQKVPVEEEIDAFDETAIHFIGYEADKPVAASRLRFEGDYGKLERICVMKEQRGKHFGKMLMHKMEAMIQAKGYQKAKLNAQTHAEAFYQQLGYETISDTFLDAGIPHVTMVKTL
ncbi:GNAT family N-acetyltransferase [Oceanobacillus sp. FSL H7-0719]|uniref:GNAT family N-acetyltransferase n=1 Tax=Oceanobacillus sp. FSL H7-0719 TaxID=2954507 RepID=UPI003244468D